MLDLVTDPLPRLPVVSQIGRRPFGLLTLRNAEAKLGKRNRAHPELRWWMALQMRAYAVVAIENGGADVGVEQRGLRQRSGCEPGSIPRRADAFIGA